MDYIWSLCTTTFISVGVGYFMCSIIDNIKNYQYNKYITTNQRHELKKLIEMGYDRLYGLYSNIKHFPDNIIVARLFDNDNKVKNFMMYMALAKPINTNKFLFSSLLTRSVMSINAYFTLQSMFSSINANSNPIYNYLITLFIILSGGISIFRFARLIINEFLEIRNIKYSLENEMNVRMSHNIVGHEPIYFDKLFANLRREHVAISVMHFKLIQNQKSI